MRILICVCLYLVLSGPVAAHEPEGQGSRVCWSEVIRDDPARNFLMLCADGDVAGLVVFFANDAESDPTICRSVGTTTSPRRDSREFRIDMGRCENGRTVQPLTLQCSVPDDAKLICDNGSGLELVFEREFPPR